MKIHVNHTFFKIWLWAFFRPNRRGGTTKRPFLKIPGAPARRGNASRELAKKGPVFENSWRPCEARQGLAESLSSSLFRPPSVFRLPDPLRIPAPGFCRRQGEKSWCTRMGKSFMTGSKWLQFEEWIFT